MVQKLIENYVYNMKEMDVKNFALKNGIILNDDEVIYVLNIIKKNYRTIIYGNPEPIFSDLKNKFPLETVNKIEKLYIEFKSKYETYFY